MTEDLLNRAIENRLRKLETAKRFEGSAPTRLLYLTHDYQTRVGYDAAIEAKKLSMIESGKALPTDFFVAVVGVRPKAQVNENDQIN